MPMILLLRSRELSLKTREKPEIKGFELMNPPLGRNNTHARYDQLYELLEMELFVLAPLPVAAFDCCEAVEKGTTL